MRRRDFITLLGGAVAAWPLTARAQQTGKMPTIGVLGANASLWRPWTDAFVQRLRELGWIEGRTVAIEYRWNEGRPERSADIAAEFVQRRVDLIVAQGTATPIVKLATSVIPIIFPIAPDPVGSGLVASFARPGGNITGISIQSTDLASKRLDLLREIVPRLRHLAIMANVDNSQAVLELGEAEATAKALGIEISRLEIHRADDITPAFTTHKSQADALYVVTDALIGVNRTRIITLALAARLPTIFPIRDYAQAGGLMSYGPNFVELFRHAADMADKILRGTKPADIPVEQPTKFELVVNLTTAKALGLTIPEAFLARADELIE